MGKRTQVVVIVGGGIAGMATAYYLEEGARRRQEPFTMILIEKSARWGGKILTERSGGFLIEGGPDAFLAQKPAAINFCERLGLHEELMGTNPLVRTTYLLSDGKLVPLPPGFTGFLPAAPKDLLAASFLSLPAKIRVALEPFVPRKVWREEEDESMAGFLSRRFGAEAYAKLLEPLLAGIFGGDGEALSIRGTFPRFVELERKYGSVLKGMKRGRAGRKEIGGRPASPFITLQSGLGKLVERLRERLRQVIFMAGAEAAALRPHAMAEGEPGQYVVTLADGKQIYGDAVVLAVPAFEAARLVEPLDLAAARQLRAIPYVSTATVSLGFRREDVPHPMDGTGFVIPRAERRSLTAATWFSSKWENRAPEHAVLIRCYLGRVGAEEILGRGDDELVQFCRQELREIMGIAGRPILERVYRWERSMPQYLVEHVTRVRGIMDRLAVFPGVFLTGSAYRGVGIPDCIADAEDAAAKVLGHLTTQLALSEG